MHVVFGEGGSIGRGAVVVLIGGGERLTGFGAEEVTSMVREKREV